MSKKNPKCLNNHKCCEKNRTSQCDRVLGWGGYCKLDGQEHFFAEVTFEMKPDDERSQPGRDQGEEGRARQWGHAVGHGPQPGGGRQSPTPSHLPRACRVSPTSARHCHRVSVQPSPHLPGLGPEVAHLFTLVSIHNVWQTGGVQ